MKNNTLIRLPANPFWKVFKTFGADELVALSLNTVATALFAAYLATQSGASFLLFVGVSAAMALSLVGPIMEKVGFFPMHFYEVWENYKTTPMEERKKFGFYFSEATKGGMKTLIRDLLIHCPLYVALMYYSLLFFTATPAWILCVFNFGLATVVTTSLEVSLKEILHRIEIHRLLKKGFESERYYEARFCFSDEKLAKRVFQSLAQKYVFDIPCGKDDIVCNKEVKVRAYHDRYFTEKNGWNGRTMQLRSRERDEEKGRKMRTWQFIYTFVNEGWKGDADQYRYFVARKEKIYYMAPDNILLHSPKEIADKKVRRMVLSRIKNETPVDVKFERLIAERLEGLLISFDRILEHNLFIIEIKARPDRKRLLREAMKFAMLKGGSQTTHGKFSLINNTLPIF